MSAWGEQILRTAGTLSVWRLFCLSSASAQQEEAEQVEREGGLELLAETSQ